MVKISALEQSLAVIMVLFSWSLALRLLPMVEPLPSRRLVKYAPQSKPQQSMAAVAAPLVSAEAAQEAYDADQERLREPNTARGAFSWRLKERRRSKRSWLGPVDSSRVIDPASSFQIEDIQNDASGSYASVTCKRASMESNEKQIDLGTMMYQPKRESVPNRMYKSRDNHLVDAILDLKYNLLKERRNEENAKSLNLVENSIMDTKSLKKYENSQFIDSYKPSLASDRTLGKAFTSGFRSGRTLFWRKSEPNNPATQTLAQSSVLDKEKSRERKSVEDSNKNLKLVTKVGNTYIKAPKRNFQFESIDTKGDVSTKPEDRTVSDFGTVRSSQNNQNNQNNMTQTPLRQYKPTGSLPCFQVPCGSNQCRTKNDDCCSGKNGMKKCGKQPCDAQTCCSGSSGCGRKIYPTQHHAPSTPSTMSGSPAAGANEAQKLSVIVWDPITEPNKLSPTLMLLPKSIINLPKFVQGNESREDKSARRSANPFFRLKPSGEDWLDEVNPAITLDEYLADKAVQTVQNSALEDDTPLDQSTLNKIYNLNQQNNGAEVRVAVPDVLGGYMTSSDILPKKDCTLQRVQYIKPSVWSRLGSPVSYFSHPNYMKPSEADRQKAVDAKAALLPELFIHPVSLLLTTSTERSNLAPSNLMTPIRWQAAPAPTTAKQTPYQVSVYVWKDNEIPKDSQTKTPLIDQNAIDLLLNQTLQARNLQDIINKKPVEIAPNKSFSDAFPRWMMKMPYEESSSRVR